MGPHIYPHWTKRDTEEKTALSDIKWCWPQSHRQSDPGARGNFMHDRGDTTKQWGKDGPQSEWAGETASPYGKKVKSCPYLIAWKGGLHFWGDKNLHVLKTKKINGRKWRECLSEIRKENTSKLNVKDIKLSGKTLMNSMRKNTTSKINVADGECIRDV